MPLSIQGMDVQVARDADQRLQHEAALAARRQGVTAEVEQRVVTLYGSVDTIWRKERLVQLILTLPGVKQVTSHVLAEEEVFEQLEHRLQSLLTAGKIESLPRFLVEHHIVELYGEVACHQSRSLLEREALDVPGVCVVLNHLRLPQESGTPVHTTNR
jgi:osmotically-inducible protein OsmY